MHKLLRLLPFAGLFLAVQLPAQINAPFSRFGIGHQQPDYFTVNRSMGGFSAAYRAHDHINFQNPASYTAFYQQLYRTIYDKQTRDTTVYDSTLAQFVNRVVVDSIGRDTIWGIIKSTSFEGGVYADVVTVSNAAEEMQGGSASLGYLAFGFPVPKVGGISFGLMPLSNVQYDIISSQFIDSVTGRQNYKFSGSGGLYRFYVGGAAEYKRFPAGINGSYIFGTVNIANIAYFPDQPNSFGARQQITSHVRGITWSGGVQYRQPLSDKLELVAGAFGNPKSSIKATTDTIWDWVLLVDEVQFPHVDTISAVTGTKNNLQLPAIFGVGLMLANRSTHGEDANWLFGADVTFEQWADVPNYLASTPQQNTYRVALGGEFIPKIEGTYLQRVNYRLGGYYGNSPLIVKNEQVQDYGITFGLGLPLKRARGANTMLSTVDMAFQFGSRGSVQQNGLREDYFRMTVGFNLNDNSWIFKSKFY